MPRFVALLRGVNVGKAKRVPMAQDTKALSGLAAVESLVVPPEQFAMGKNAAYLLCARGNRRQSEGHGK